MILKSDGGGAPITIHSLSVAYRTEAVLWDVSWSAREGAMTAIVGPNGAGKTTMLNAAIGLVPALAGDATFWGQPFSAVRERVAYVPQRESVDWDFPVTALEVVEMGATRRLGWLLPSWAGRFGSAQRSQREVARAALERVGMQDFGDRPIGQLSGGQQQRVFLARALAQDADLYLLDEPFAGVDVATEAVIAKELRRLCGEGKTVVAVHHDIDSVARQFDDVVLLDRTVIAVGAASETLTPANLARTYDSRNVLARA